ncbi:hypothetical protein [Hydrogenophaga intermedia]|uniref:hypothetical protein n=1 Tax=Hydrogenophaga intermedia TaxID=65786 RepID=UPI002044B73A|nr:hypothetical protein [Hydrogenophaga intermedia]MCM3563129.1 hypothetical protein [Hydrogenophaga intermedia]
MRTFQLSLTPEQHDVLAAWLPDDHEASLALLGRLKEHARWGQQRPQDKDTFAQLRAMETAATAALWVLQRLPPTMHQKSQLDTAVRVDKTSMRPPHPASAHPHLPPQTS